MQRGLHGLYCTCASALNLLNCVSDSQWKLQPSIREAFPAVSVFSQRAPQFHTPLPPVDQNTRLMFGRPRRIPQLLRRRWERKQERGNGACATWSGLREEKTPFIHCIRPNRLLNEKGIPVSRCNQPELHNMVKTPQWDYITACYNSDTPCSTY